MGKWLEKYAGSYRFWILVVASAYLVYSFYYGVSGIRDSMGMATNPSLYASLSANPWWWMVLFYSSEGVAGAVAIILRVVAGLFAVWGAYLFWRKKEAATPAVKRSFSVVLLLEAAFFLTYIPYIVAAAAYNLASDPTLYYFGHTPEAFLLYITLIPCLAMVLTVPPLLLKLRSAVKHNAHRQELAKWAGLTGLAYFFVVFWFNFSMMWTGIFVPYPIVYVQSGLEFLLQPANLLIFCLTVFGLLAVALTALAAMLPIIRQRITQPNFAVLGAALAGLGGYFVVTTVYYFATGGYTAHPSVWYELIGPLHDPHLWVIALLFLGIPLMLYGRNQRRRTNT